MIRTITIQDLNKKSGDQVLREYEMQSARWGKSPLVQIRKDLSLIRDTFNVLGVSVSSAAHAMTMFRKAITPEMLQQLQAEIDRRKRVRRMFIVEGICAVVSVVAFMVLVVLVVQWLGILK